jgi:hypothetical protein
MKLLASAGLPLLSEEVEELALQVDLQTPTNLNYPKEASTIISFGIEGRVCAFFGYVRPQPKHHVHLQGSTRGNRQKDGPSINTLNGRRSARRAHRTLRGSHLATRFDARTADLERLEDRLYFLDFGETALVDGGSAVDSSEAA